MNVVYMLSFILFFPYEMSFLQEMTSWKKIKLSENSLANKVPLSDKSLDKNLFCSSFCSSMINCNLWCVKSDGLCYFYELFVSPAYESTTGNINDCYTKNRNDIAFLTSISSVGDYFSNKPEVLIDGIKDDEYCTIENSHPWILIDLQKNALIYDVIVHVTHSPVWGPFYCQYLEVRTSSTAPLISGDFSSWNLFYYLDRECVGGAIEHLKPSNPQVGQYVSIKRKTKGLFCLTHIEIDGVYIAN